MTTSRAFILALAGVCAVAFVALAAWTPKGRELLFKAKAWTLFHVVSPVVRLFCVHQWQSLPKTDGGRRWVCPRCVWVHEGGPHAPNAWDYLLTSRTIRSLALIAAGVIAGLAVWGKIELLLMALGKSR
jgi:hypothetical protein